MKQIALVLAILLFFGGSSFAAKDVVSRDGYVFGGTVGSIAGFGIGHGVQGRYQKMGWIFTVGEGLGILSALTIPWIIRVSGNQSIAPEVISKVGWGLFAGFRLWQITDLWVFAKPERAVIASMQERHWQNGWWGEEKVQASSALSLNILEW